MLNKFLNSFVINTHSFQVWLWIVIIEHKWVECVCLKDKPVEKLSYFPHLKFFDIITT